jgi:periplasmic protein TonB
MFYEKNIILLFRSSIDAQNSVPFSIEGQRIYTVVEQMPQFPGGNTALFKFLSENIKYPSVDRENGIEGKICLNFVIDTSGNIINPVVRRSLSGVMDEELLQLLSKMPKWIPGQQNGKKVNVSFTLPMHIRYE